MSSETKSLLSTMAIFLSIIVLIVISAIFMCYEGPGYIFYSERGVDKIMHVQSYLPISSRSARIVTDDGDIIYFQNIYEYYTDAYIEEK